jgi:hypothetical protein
MTNSAPYKEIATEHRVAVLGNGRKIYVRKSAPSEILGIQALVAREIAGKVASWQTMERFYALNRDSFWSICEMEARSLIGCILFLLPNTDGVDAILSQKIDATEPPPELFVGSDERPAAIYIWALVARKMAKQALGLVTVAMSPTLYGGLPIYTRAGTVGGFNALVSGGSQSLGTPHLGGVFQMQSPSGAGS